MAVNSLIAGLRSVLFLDGVLRRITGVTVRVVVGHEEIFLSHTMSDVVQ